jgi:hypothetical protein
MGKLTNSSPPTGHILWSNELDSDNSEHAHTIFRVTSLSKQRQSLLLFINPASLQEDIGKPHREPIQLFHADIVKLVESDIKARSVNGRCTRIRKYAPELFIIICLNVTTAE